MYTQNTNEFAATNLRSSPKRHERLGGPLTVLVRDRWQNKKDTHKGCLFVFEPLAGLEPAIYVSEPPIWSSRGAITE